jgi:hypothetical protein
MSGLTEQEILTKFQQSLKEGRDACQWLAKNADPEWLAPRGRHYRLLKTALSELEGCARQMSAFRDDARWLPLGILYGAKTSRLAQKYFTYLQWSKFGELAKVFDLGLAKMQELQAKTGRAGPILPKRTDWLILPNHNIPKPRPTFLLN